MFTQLQMQIDVEGMTLWSGWFSEKVSALLETLSWFKNLQAAKDNIQYLTIYDITPNTIQRIFFMVDQRGGQELKWKSESNCGCCSSTLSNLTILFSVLLENVLVMMLTVRLRSSLKVICVCVCIYIYIVEYVYR